MAPELQSSGSMQEQTNRPSHYAGNHRKGNSNQSIMNRPNSQLAEITRANKKVASPTPDLMNNQNYTQHFRCGNFFGTISGPSAQSRPANPLLVSLSINGIDAWIETSSQLLQEICSLQPDGVTLDNVPMAYRGIFFEAVFAELLNFIEIKGDSHIIVNHVYEVKTGTSIETIFSDPPQANYHVLSYEIRSSTGDSHPLNLKINGDLLPLLQDILLPAGVAG